MARCGSACWRSALVGKWGWVPASARTRGGGEAVPGGEIPRLRFASLGMKCGGSAGFGRRGGGRGLHPHPPSSRGQALAFPPQGEGREWVPASARTRGGGVGITGGAAWAGDGRLPNRPYGLFTTRALVAKAQSIFIVMICGRGMGSCLCRKRDREEELGVDGSEILRRGASSE